MKPPSLQLGGLDPERFVRLRNILDQVLDLPAEEAHATLANLCAGDRDLEAQALALLQADGELSGRESATDAFLSGRFLAIRVTPDLELEGNSPAPLDVEAGASGEIDSLVGHRAGPYHLDREIGRGGMGRVYLAHRADGQFERTVAIKVLKRGVDTDDVLRRFLQERQILARLEHPNIARLLDGGATDDGRPFLAMELVEGVPLTEWCDAHAASLDQRLDLFLAVCAAVQYAHRHLVVHRDLKPGNVLVTAEGQPKLLDFGIAHLLTSQEDSGAEPLTRLDSLPMTPAYAAPEQLLGEPATTQTDVYGLGVILYQLLARKRPFELRSRGVEEMRREILERAPVPPSQAAPESTRAALRGDLDAIVLTALATEPGRRYESVEAFTEDLRRYRDHLPVRARKPGRVYRLRKLARRHAGAVVAGSILVALLAAYAVTTAVMLDRQRRERTRAETEARRAERIQEFLGDMLASAGPARPGTGTEQLGLVSPTATIRDALDAAASKAERELSDDPPVLAGVEYAIGETYFSLGVYDQAERHARAALAIRDPLGDPQLSETLNLLSQVLQRETHYEEALRHAHRATELDRKAYGPESGNVAIALQNEQAILKSMGRSEEADALIAEAARIGRSVFSDDDPRFVEILASEAMSLSRTSGLEAAEAPTRDVAARVRKIYGEEHPRTSMALSNLATLLGDLKRYAEAESLHRVVLDMRRKTMGADHPAVATTLSNLGLTLREQGKLDEAESMLREAVAMRTRLLGPENRETLVSQSLLANVLLKQGKPRQAEWMHRSILDARRRTLGYDHPLVASSLLSLSDALAAQDRRREAIAYASEAVTLRERILPAGNPDIAKAKARLDALEHPTQAR